MAESIITVEGLSYTYRGASQKALDGINFSIDESECVGITGPSESGKSTLCYAIASILAHYFTGGSVGGRVLVRGLDAFSTPLHVVLANVGFLMQNSSLMITGIKPTVFEEIAFSLENLGMERAFMVERAQHVMKQVGISHLANRSPLALSGGEMQRVALASVLALDPPILILDEPTSSLDPEGVQQLSSVLKRMKGKKTILIVEQKMEIFPGLIDRLIVLDQGKLIHAGSPVEFFSNPESIQQEIGAPIWTELVYRIGSRLRRPDKALPYTYREALNRLL